MKTATSSASRRRSRARLAPAWNRARLMLALALGFTILGAGVFRTPAILFLTSVLCAAPFVAALVSRTASRGLRTWRQMPTRGVVGAEVRARLTVSNVGWCPAPIVHVRGAAKVSRREVGTLQSEDGSWTGREIDDLVIPILWPSAKFEGEVAWQLTRRGVWQVPGAGAGAFDPMGLSNGLPSRSPAQEFVCLPRALHLHRLGIAGASPGAQPRGAALVADAAEPHGVRPHQPGEGLRRVNWKATARSGVLHVVEWEEESGADIVVLLDTQLSSTGGAAGDDTLEASVMAAATLATYTLEHGQRVRLFWWGEGASAPKLMRVEGASRGALGRILEALARLQPCESSGATLDALARVVSREVAAEQTILALGSDRSGWHWGGSRGSRGSRWRGLAFDCASFEDPIATGGNLVSSDACALPSHVRRVKRSDSLRQILERNW